MCKIDSIDWGKGNPYKERKEVKRVKIKVKMARHWADRKRWKA